jgi:hypothetical protein
VPIAASGCSPQPLGQAIDAWQAVRPDQPPFVDRSSNEHVDLMFAFPARRVSSS